MLFYLKNYRLIHLLVTIFIYIGFIFLIEFDKYLLDDIYLQTLFLFVSLFTNNYALVMSGLNDKYINDKIDTLRMKD